MQQNKLRRRILCVSILAVACVLAAAGVVQHKASASWAAMERQAAAMDAAWAARDHLRQPLWGSSTEGSAFDHYERAQALAKPLGEKDFTELVATLRRTDAQVASETVELRARWRPALLALRAGAHCTDARPLDIPVSDPGAGIASLLDCRWITNVAVFEARALRHAGQHRQAVEWTLDAATLGGDLVQQGILINQIIGIAMVAIAVGEAWPDVALQQLDGETLDLFATGLERLDRRLPSSLDFVGELRFMASYLQKTPIDEETATAWDAWRYGFSTRWMVADGFAQVATAMAKLEEGADFAWPRRRVWMEEGFRDLVAGANPVTNCFIPNVSSAELNLREVLTQVRILRVAVDARRGVTGSLPDPLGEGPLALIAEPEGLRIRSAGERNEAPIERFVRRQ